MLQVIRSGNRSVVGRAYASSPLKLLTPRNHGGAAWIYTATYGGGLVDGDAIQLSMEVGRDAMALLSTQASTKVYRSPNGTTVAVDATVAAGALLAVLPDPVVCFTGARYRQSQTFHLSSSASVILADWFSSGRRAAGERWAFDEYVSRTRIEREGRLVCIDALTLSSSDGDLAERMGRFDVICTLALIGPHVSDRVNAILAAAAKAPIVRHPIQPESTARVSDDGAVLRFAGTSVEQVGRAVRERLQFVPALLGDSPWTRKW